MCGHHFPGNRRHLSPQRGVHGVVNLGGVAKTLRRSNSLSRTVFSTAGSFGNAVARLACLSSASVAETQSTTLALQTRAPWTEVKLAQISESCLAGVQKVFWAEGSRVSQESLALGQARFAPKQGLRPCNPMLRQCNKHSVHMSAKTFCALSKHFGPDQLVWLLSLAAWFATLYGGSPVVYKAPPRYFQPPKSRGRGGEISV